jgi:hypothetical protein
MGNPFLDRLQNKEKIGYAGRKSERKVAQSLNAQIQIASGALPGKKSDSIKKTSKDTFRIESKSSKTGTLELKKGWLDKISQEAVVHNQIPALTFSFVDIDGNPMCKLNSNWIAIPFSAFKDLVD